MEETSDRLAKINPVIIHIGDLHFGNIRVSTSHTIERLNKYAIPEIEKANIVFIVGDVFDMSISLNSTDANLIIEFFLSLFRLMEKKGIILRVLRGTLSHDRNQLILLNTIYDNNGFSFDFKYVDKILFEFIKEWRLKVVYLPDNLSFSSSKDVLSYVKNEMDMMGWLSVDYVIGHGSFVHSYPENAKVHGIIYSEEQFNFVDKYVLMGHVHTASKRGKIIYSGSFNRLQHGEESPKGFFVYTDKINFIKNPEATVFKTLYVKKDTNKDTVISQLNKFLISYFNKEERAHLRISDSPSEMKQAIKNLVYKEYPKVIVTFKKLKTTKIKYEELAIHDKIKLTHPTYANLHLLIYDTIKKNNIISHIGQERIGELIKDIRV